MSEFKSPFADMKIHLWNTFFISLLRRKPDYQNACDTMRLIEGEDRQQRNKVLPFRTVSRVWICLTCKSHWRYSQPVGRRVAGMCRACESTKLIPEKDDA